MRWPWRPREYVAVVAAIRHAEAALERRDVEAHRQRETQREVRTELHRRKEKP